MKAKQRKATATAVLVLFAFAVPVRAQNAIELPDAPQPKPNTAVDFTVIERPKVRFDRPVHKFYDKTAKIELGVNAALFAIDAGQTCHNLANGGHEDVLPTQSCAGAIGIMAGLHGGQEVLAWVLHKTGHHKLERIARLYMTEAHVQAIAYSKAHGAF